MTPAELDVVLKVGAALGGLGALITALFSLVKVHTLKVEIDGRLTQLLESKDREGVANVTIARAEGHAAGVSDEQARVAATPTPPVVVVTHP